MSHMCALITCCIACHSVLMLHMLVRFVSKTSSLTLNSYNVLHGVFSMNVSTAIQSRRTTKAAQQQTKAWLNSRDCRAVVTPYCPAQTTVYDIITPHSEVRQTTASVRHTTRHKLRSRLTTVVYRKPCIRSNADGPSCSLRGRWYRLLQPWLRIWVLDSIQTSTTWRIVRPSCSQ